MLDLFGIMFSSIVMMLVILRAIQSDATTPWYKATRKQPDDSGLKLDAARVRTAAQEDAIRRDSNPPRRV